MNKRREVEFSRSKKTSIKRDCSKMFESLKVKVTDPVAELIKDKFSEGIAILLIPLPVLEILTLDKLSGACLKRKNLLIA